jgi:diaminohydroxyphosphoribosylaminopyrimidine deaminase/5-amino-6-(5-phosphoribosylamino)uracil reductase
VFTATDHALMARALRLAERGLATTMPNPRVGCVIAHGDDIVGEGWHRSTGGPHAEIFALREARERARGATAYATLEPCGKHGRTPPCADALIEAGIARVVVASEDAYQNDGGALDRLRAAGIAVDIGLMRDAARELNRGFFSRIERGRPWVRVKLAMSLDGRTALASGESKWITGAAARADVQRWRARSSAILTASGSAIADDPHLTVRSEGTARDRGTPDAFPPNVPPLRVALDAKLAIPAGAHLLDGGVPTLIVHAPGVRAGEKHSRVECATVETRAGRLDLASVLALLASRGVNELQVEAGPTLAGALYDAGLADEWLVYVAPVWLGADARPLAAFAPIASMAARPQFHVVDRRMIGVDERWLLRGATDAESIGKGMHR